MPYKSGLSYTVKAKEKKGEKVADASLPVEIEESGSDAIQQLKISISVGEERDNEGETVRKKEGKGKNGTCYKGQPPSDSHTRFTPTSLCRHQSFP